MANFFDQFDKPEAKQANFFDQFDEPEAKQANFFDQFDEPVAAKPEPAPKPARVTTAPTSMSAPVVVEQVPAPVQAFAPEQTPAEPVPTSELAPEFYYATPQRQPKLPGSVMAGINEDLPPAQVPQFDPQVKTLYDAASQQERLKLAQADIRFAEVAKYYQDVDLKNQQYLATNPSGFINPNMGDDRLEYRVRDYVQQGMSPEVALNIAKQDALKGRPSHVSTTGEVKEAPEDYLLKRSYALDPKAPGYETALKLAQRTALKSMYGFAQAGGGQQKFLAEAILGVDPSDTNKTLDYISKNTQALGDPTSKPLALVENAVSSIIQQLPGLLTGTQSLALGSMFLQSFGQTYDDSRRKNLGIGESTFRSTAYGAFEVLGEKLGLGDTLKGIKAAARGVPDKELIEHFAKALAKEIPGEQLTYAGQFGVDKAFALNPEAGIKQFLNGAVDTLAATVVQGGIMMGGAAAINKANQTYSDAAGTRQAETAAETAKQNALQKAQDMFKFTPKEKAETTEQQADTTPSNQEAPEFDKYGYFDLPEYQKLSEKRDAISAQHTALVEKADNLPKDSEEQREAIRASNNFYYDFYEPLNAQMDAIREAYAPQAPAPTPEQEAPVPVEPTPEQEAPAPEQTVPEPYIDPETGEVIEGRVEPTIGGGGNDAVVQRRAAELVSELGLPKNVALAVAQREALEGGQNVERAPAESVTGRVEPSFSVPEQGATTTEGIAPSDTTGLAGPVEDTESLVGREEAEPTALGEIPTLTERAPVAEEPVVEAPAATPVEQAQTKLAEAEAAVAEAVTPEQKKEATQQRNVARQEVKQAQAAAPVVTTIDWDFINKEIAKIKRKVANAERVERRAEIGPASKAAKEKLAKALEEGRNFYAKWNPIIEADREARAVKTDTPVTVETLTTETPAVVEAPATTTTTEAAKPKRGRPPKPKVESAEPAALKPKGRPKVELTPEEQAARAEARKKVQGELIKAQRAVDRAVAKLQEKVDTNRFDTPAALETATDILRQERNQAIYVLSAAASNPMFRNVESSGVKAKQFLASDAITLQERANIAERLKFEETRSKRKAQAAPDSRLTKLGKSGVNTKTNRELYKFSNAADAATYIANTGTVFERALARRLLPFLTGVNLVIADTEENTIDSAKNVLGKDSAAYFADTSFGEAFKMIVLRGENYGGKAAHGVNNVTFLHEALHAAVGAKIDQAMRFVKAGRVKDMPPKLFALINDLYGIMNRAQDNYDALKASGAPISEQLQHLFEGISIGTNIDEFVSYGLTDVELQKFLLGTPALAERDRSIIDDIKNLFTKFVQTLRSAFDLGANHQSAFQDLIFATEGLLIEEKNVPAEVEELRLAAKNLNASTAKVDKNLNKIAASNNQQDVIDGIQGNVPAHDFGMYEKLMQARLPAMGNGFISKSLITMQTADILRWQGDAIPALKKIDELIERMAGSRLNMEKAFAKKADKLAKFIRYSNRDSRQALSNAMHLARLESVSPTEFADRQDALTNDRRVTELNVLLNDPRTNSDELGAITAKRTRREASINKTFDAWDKLGTVKDGQEMYRMVRQFYKDMNLLHRTLLDARIDRLNLSGTVNDPTTPKGKLMLSVRRMYEGSDFAGIEEYFPFMRHGDYWLRVNGPQGREFYMFDNGTDRNAFLLTRAKQIGINSNDPDAFDAGDNTQELRNKYSGESKILAEMFDVIDQQFDKAKALQASSKAMTAAELQQAENARMNELEQLKDSLYQTYLMTMPEQSYRKQFLHAENVTGFSSDVLRNFKVSATRLAAQAAKLTYGDAINTEVQRGYDTLKGMPALERAKMRLFVDEIDKRVQTELNPPPHDAFATGINQFAYYWLLTGVASAITQTTSLPIIVMPILNDDYGYGKSAAKFAKYMQIWKSVGATEDAPNGDVSWAAPSIGLSKMVQSNPILRRAFDEAIERGITSQTQTSVLTNRNRTPANAYSNIPGAVLRSTAIGMSALFNGAERMTREMTYMMTFELEYAKTGDFDKSVQRAIDVVQETLGRYDNFNRPRILQNFLGRTVGQFKMYAVNMTSFFMRNGYNIFKGMFTGDPKLALSATHRLGSVLTMGALFGGITALPMYSFICFVIDVISDEEDEKKRRLKNPITADNADLRFRYDFLRTTFGDVKFTGMDGREHTLAKVLEKGAISELSDINIGSRTSFDGMWWRGGKQGDNMQETIQNYFIANLGPAASTILGMPAAIDDFRKGNILRGVERVLPALPKNVFTAIRLGSEGAKTPQGNVVMSKKEFSEVSLFMQGLGFQSTTLARVQENAYALRREEKSAENSKKDLMARLDDVFLDPNKSAEDKKKFMAEIGKHNKRYQVIPSLTIDADAIFDSIDRSIDSMGLKFRGLRIKEEMLPFMLPQRKAAYPGRKVE